MDTLRHTAAMSNRGYQPRPARTSRGLFGAKSSPASSLGTAGASALRRNGATVLNSTARPAVETAAGTKADGPATGPRESTPAAVPSRDRREVALSWLAILLTLVAATQVGREFAATLAANFAAGRWGAVALDAMSAIVMALLVYGGLVFLLTRALFYLRRSRHRPETTQELAELCNRDDNPLLTILVPSYREEARVVLRTLLSAALQSYPRRRVVLLIDDPPTPRTSADRATLLESRALPGRVAEILEEPRAWVRQCLGEDRPAIARPLPSVQQVVRLLERISRWFENLAARFDPSDHEEKFFVEQILLASAERCAERVRQIEEARRRGEPATASRLATSACRFLDGLFRVELSSFERKRFANLSHEPNKAMNLNSYISLVGRSLKARRCGDELLLVPSDGPDADLQVPDSEFLICLDADSLILPDYALRLIHYMQKPGNERTAVVQTPYSAFPGAPRRLERLAGATTDIQYIIHQGFTGCSGTYWVGANALLRKSALDDIALHEQERGHSVTRYIQDRTVIEDTESSIDLVARGWTLHNYPERLAFSATPPDFGALLIQRRRWANGGLIIFPKLARYLLANVTRPAAWAEGFVRVHYLVSIAAVNLGLVFLFANPSAVSSGSWWLPASAVPYFLLYARDLRLSGYRYRDIFGVYALNLLLVPVNLGGVFKSIQQMWTGRKSPFGRTPKVGGRTAAGLPYLLAVYALLLECLTAAGADFYGGRLFHGVCAVLNAGFVGYAAIFLVGLTETWQDVRAALARPDRRRVSVLSASPRPAPSVVAERVASER